MWEFPGVRHITVGENNEAARGEKLGSPNFQSILSGRSYRIGSFTPPACMCPRRTNIGYDLKRSAAILD